jgi:hypothetical protein
MECTNVLVSGVKQVSSDVSKSSSVLTGALKKLQDKANATEGSLDTVLKLTMQQQSVLDSAQRQLTTLGQLTTNMSNIDLALTNTLAGLTVSNAVTSDLASCVSAVVKEGATARLSLEESLAAVVEKLDSSAIANTSVATMLEANSEAAKAAAHTIASQLEAGAIAAGSVTTSLEAVAAASELIANKLDVVAAADVKAAVVLNELSQQASAAIGKVDQTLEQLQQMVRQFSALDASLQTQSSKLKQVAGQIKDVGVSVEMLPPAEPYKDLPWQNKTT